MFEIVFKYMLEIPGLKMSKNKMIGLMCSENIDRQFWKPSA